MYLANAGKSNNLHGLHGICNTLVNIHTPHHHKDIIALNLLKDKGQGEGQQHHLGLQGHDCSIQSIFKSESYCAYLQSFIGHSQLGDNVSKRTFLLSCTCVFKNYFLKHQWWYVLVKVQINMQQTVISISFVKMQEIFCHIVPMIRMTLLFSKLQFFFATDFSIYALNVTLLLEFQVMDSPIA